MEASNSAMSGLKALRDAGVVAEGVERAGQLDQLRALGCDRAQGFLFVPAGPSEMLEARVLGVPGLTVGGEVSAP